MARKVIQIACSSTAESPSGQHSSWETLVALCDDGSMWRMDMNHKREWELFQNVPQEADRG